jgi:hypothetical protein
MRTPSFPECCVPPMDLEEVRQLVRYRMDTGESVDEVKNKVHALISRNLFDSELAEFSDVFGCDGLERRAALPWPESEREALAASPELRKGTARSSLG